MFGIQSRVVASITLRATLGRKRALLFALPSLILLALTVLLTLAHPERGTWRSDILGSFGLLAALPLTALIIGTSVLGAEIDDASIVHLLATPVPRRVVVLSKLAVGAALTMLFAALPELLAGLIATGGATRLALGMFTGALAGAVMYNAIFIMISVVTTRAVAVGLGYLLVWEGLLAGLVSGARLLSIGHYALAVARSVAGDPAVNAGIGLGTALIMGVIVTAAALAVAVTRLASFTIKGDAA